MSVSKPAHGTSAGRAQFCVRLVAPAVLIALTACNETGGSGPGGVSEGEARALEEAAEMLDARRLPDEALPAVEGPPVEGATDAGESGEDTAEMTGDNSE